MTNSELLALELQARIMGWEPAVTWDSVVNVPGPTIIIPPLPRFETADGLDHSEY
jgi:hypothetical protein